MPKKLLTIQNMGMKGINSDLAPWDLPAEYLTVGDNFRITANSIVVTGSYDSWDTPPASFNAGHILFAGALSANYWIVAGRSAVYAFDGGTWTDITSVIGYATLGVDDELNWTSCMLGSIPIINNPKHFPEYWSPQNTSTQLAPLEFSAGVTFDSANISFEVLRSHKNYLFALNLTESGTELPSSYRWSHPADNNGLPFTWDENDLSGIAGKAQIGGNSGKLVDGLSLRDSFCLYSERGVNILDYKGDEFVWSRRELSSTIGLLNKNCIAEVKGVHYFLGDGDIYKNDGHNIESALHNRLRTRFNERVSSDYFTRSYIVNNVSAKELWFCIPEGTNAYANTAFVYNWKDDSWAMHEIPANIAHSAYGIQSEPPLTYANIDQSYSETLASYGSQVRTPLNETVVGIDATDSSIKLLDPKNVPLPSGLISKLERTDFALDGHRQVNTITRVYPHMKGTDPVEIQIGSQFTAGGAVNWSTPRTFTPNVDRKIDVISTGMLHAWRIKNVLTGRFEISGMDFEYSPSGER